MKLNIYGCRLLPQTVETQETENERIQEQECGIPLHEERDDLFSTTSGIEKARKNYCRLLEILDINMQQPSIICGPCMDFN